tara:strand:- start:20545 stop:21687 length:1143 start_codon:yes stop_codon:yes gene_type:complete
LNKKIINFIRELYFTENFVQLHKPFFSQIDKSFVVDSINSSYVSSVGKYVDDFEKKMATYIGSKHAIAVVNGTSALHIALHLSGVKKNDLVITQALSFVATANAIKYLDAEPVFLDIDKNTHGLCHLELDQFLKDNARVCKNGTFHKLTGQRISACVPMHTYGFPVKIDKIINVCNKYGINVIEDAAESIGSEYYGKKTGSFGLFGVFSFNGNKTITCGGGGLIVTNDAKLATEAKHITTQAKIPHKWNYVHDKIGYNYRLPNLNAALACSQLTQLNEIIENKRETATLYSNFFKNIDVKFLCELENTKSNYWLNSIIFKDENSRNDFLKESNQSGVMTRPSWKLLNKLRMFSNCLTGNLVNSTFLESRLVNIPSGYRLK